jgi:hypothetical protein
MKYSYYTKITLTLCEITLLHQSNAISKPQHNPIMDDDHEVDEEGKPRKELDYALLLNAILPPDIRVSSASFRPPARFCPYNCSPLFFGSVYLPSQHVPPLILLPFSFLHSVSLSDLFLSKTDSPSPCLCLTSVSLPSSTFRFSSFLPPFPCAQRVPSLHQVLGWAPVPLDFSARFSCYYRVYDMPTACLSALCCLLAAGSLYALSSLLAAGCGLFVCWLLAAGCWLLAAGCWLLAAGCWPLAPSSPASNALLSARYRYCFYADSLNLSLMREVAKDLVVRVFLCVCCDRAAFVLRFSLYLIF